MLLSRLSSRSDPHFRDGMPFSVSVAKVASSAEHAWHDGERSNNRCWASQPAPRPSFFRYHATSFPYPFTRKSHPSPCSAHSTQRTPTLAHLARRATVYKAQQAHLHQLLQLINPSSNHVPQSERPRNVLGPGGKLSAAQCEARQVLSVRAKNPDRMTGRRELTRRKVITIVDSRPHCCLAAHSLWPLLATR
jgi:hypothetical protein